VQGVDALQVEKEQTEKKKMSERTLNKMAMLMDLSEWQEENNAWPKGRMDHLRKIDFGASDWHDQLQSCQVDLILVKMDTFRKILHRSQDPLPEWIMATRLTAREKDILSLSAEGKMIKEMAGILSVSEKTIKTHLSNIYLKLGVKSRTEAIAWFYNNDFPQRD